MNSLPDPWAANPGTYSTSLPSNGLTETERDVTTGKLTYGGFIFWLQRLGINPRSVRSSPFGTPIERGVSFSVSRHWVSPGNYRAMNLSVSVPGLPLFYRNIPPMYSSVAFKRLIVKEQASKIDVSEQGQLTAICREVQALIHPKLRDHESIIKLQAIIWENGFGAGNESDLPMWPTLVLEYCQTTLADYQSKNPPLSNISKAAIGSKIGNGLGALHSADIFHGDLKSENVLVNIGKSGILEPKLADFGCSVMLEETAGNKEFWIGGTEPWCAPEVRFCLF